MTDRQLPHEPDPMDDPVMKAQMERLVADGVRRGVDLVQGIPELANPNCFMDGFVAGAVVSTVMLRAYANIHSAWGGPIADDWLMRAFGSFRTNLKDQHGINLDIHVLRTGE
jgi:hypothetical protein